MSMAKYLIVGGGFAGLLVGKVLRAHGIEFVGLEKSERLGGRIEVGHHRIYNKESLSFFQNIFRLSSGRRLKRTLKRGRKEFGLSQETSLVKLSLSIFNHLFSPENDIY